MSELRRAAIVYNPVKVDLEAVKAAVARAQEAAGWDETLWFETSVEDPGAGQTREALEQGVDMVFTNWRGLVAAPGIPDADKQKLVAAVTALHGTEQWKKTLAEKGWADAFIVGDEFKTFLTSESDRVAGVLQELGLA